jgi:hypothetical protein
MCTCAQSSKNVVRDDMIYDTHSHVRKDVAMTQVLCKVDKTLQWGERYVRVTADGHCIIL